MENVKKWYEEAVRFGQVNLTEIDPEICNIDFWIGYFKKTGIQAVILNAGGIVAYYPSQFKMQYRAAKLGGRDFFGEFCGAARKASLYIVARMDCNRATGEFYQEKPEWFAQRLDGSPYIVQGRYQSCVNSGYYKDYIPQILKEIIDCYHPDGFADNSWTGIRRQICYCDNCKKSFRKYSGSELPLEENIADPVYKKWTAWSYKCRMDNWDLFNKITTESGGSDCVWAGMTGGTGYLSGKMGFSDIWEISKKSNIILVDSQGRNGNGFEENGLIGLLLHQMTGWDKKIPESMSTYVKGERIYRRSACPPLEAQLWMLEGISGGISPWWHIVGGNQEDRRIYDRCLSVMEFHQKNEQYLYNRKPVTNTAVLWSQENGDFYRSPHDAWRADTAFRGIVRALTRAGIPYLPVHTGDMEEQIRGMDLLVLPELAVVGEKQAEILEKYAASGGSILALGESGTMSPGGLRYKKSALENLLGLRFPATEQPVLEKEWELWNFHNYFRIEDKNHFIFKGFKDTEIIPMGGARRNIIPENGTAVLATYIPPYYIFPPEFSWPAVEKTNDAVITERRLGGGGRVIYTAWDLDSVYGGCGLPDHGDLLARMVQYLLDGKCPVRVECESHIDFKVYRQENRLIIHLINLNFTGYTPGYAEKILPAGVVRIMVSPDDFAPRSVRSALDGKEIKAEAFEGGIRVETDLTGVQELLILE
jgi:hypothetical protein